MLIFETEGIQIKSGQLVIIKVLLREGFKKKRSNLGFWLNLVRPVHDKFVPKALSALSTPPTYPESPYILGQTDLQSAECSQPN